MINRSVLMKAHTLLAAFILPVIAMFLVTGALYTWGVKGGYDVTVHELQIKKPVQGELNELMDIAQKTLKKQSIPIPTGQAKIKKIGESFKLEWSGSRIDVILEPTSDPLILKLKIKKASWYRQFVQLHKAKGGEPFKVYAVVLSVVLLALLFSGFIMAWQISKLQPLTLIFTLLGGVVFIFMVLWS